MEKDYEILEHTADIGVRAFGKTRAEVYENAARGMFSLMVAPETIRATEDEVVEVEGSDSVDLLVVWLHEILFRFDARHRVYAEFKVEATGESSLRATLRGEALDLDQHETRMEIKAVTYHGARVEERPEGWVAEVLFDI